MKIKPFKMKVTSEQSRIVQQTLFSNNYMWFTGDTTITNLSSPHLYFYEDTLRQTEDFQESFFIEHELPEITFQEFFDRYVKWCIRGNKELALWQLEDMHDKCDCHFREDNMYYKPISGLLFWTPYNNLPEDYIELTFEQFEKYVLKSKDMEKVIGYKFKKEYESYLKAYCAIVGIIPESASIVDYKETGYVFQSKSIAYDRIKNAGVLDLWFEPAYESKELYFGKVKFTIKKGYADTEYGKVTKEEVKNAIHYIENPPKLTGNTLSIHYNSTYCKITELDNNGTLSYGFDCQAGSLKELKAIYNAFE